MSIQSEGYLENGCFEMEEYLVIKDILTYDLSSLFVFKFTN